jgi:uncharacterized membrane protein
MPYCTNCGTEVPTTAAFCGHCGGAQPRVRPGPGAYRPSASTVGPVDNISPRTASILCYIPVFGVIPAIIILASHRFRGNSLVRFNAFQSVYLFVAWLIVSTAIPIVRFGLMGGGLERATLELVKLAFLICWIILLVKASQQQQLHLPIIGDLAARSTNEQL